MEDSHVPHGLDGCLDLDLDLIRFQDFLRARIFSELDNICSLVMICNMVGRGPMMDSL